MLPATGAHTHFSWTLDCIKNNMIPDKDQKILWARAAGRCAMPECRNKLTLNEEDTSEAVTLGEMCHIVGEKKSKKSPRGISKMSLEDRNRYSNLILLCVHHHRIIDKNEKAWPVEVLHQVKDDHELWVEESLESKKLSPDEIFYAETTDMISNALQLNQWNWFIDNAVRHLIHRDFVNAADLFTEREMAIDWPNSKPELREAMENLITSYIQFIDQYLDRAVPRERGEFYGPDNSYKSVYPNPNYSYESTKTDLWARKNFLLLCKFTDRLNVFAKSVRSHSNPFFFHVRGKFLIVDSLGTHLGHWGAMMDPSSIEDVDDQISKLDQQLYDLELNKNAT